jgi:hypothetical protein
MHKSSKLGLFLRFPNQNPVCISLLPVHATCPTHLLLRNLIIWIISGEQCETWSCSLCSILHHPHNSSLSGSTMFLRTLFYYYIVYLQNSNLHPKLFRLESAHRLHIRFCWQLNVHIYQYSEIFYAATMFTSGFLTVRRWSLQYWWLNESGAVPSGRAV